jgi:hypothetical protein
LNTLKSMPLIMLRCRAFGHLWEDQGCLVVTIDRVRAYDQTWHCPCGTECTDFFHWRTGARLGQRTYKWPEEYKLDEPTDRAEARKVWFERTQRK